MEENTHNLYSEEKTEEENATAVVSKEKEEEKPQQEEKEEKKEAEKSKKKENLKSPEENEEDIDTNEEENEDEMEEETVDYNSFSPEELVQETEKLVQNEYSQSLKFSMGRIKVLLEKYFADKNKERFEEYIKAGNEAKDYEEESSEDEKKYRAAYALYKKKQKAFIQELDKIKQENLKKKQEIFEKLQNLIDANEPLKSSYDKFRDLQQEWRDIGLVPREELQNLWNQYNYLVEKFLEKVQIHRELKDLDLKKNLEQKIQLCEKVEELLLETSIVKSFKALQEYHKQWKEIGAVPSDKHDEIWERFKQATDKINERRKDFYEQRQQDQEKNYEAKLALCEKAENMLAKLPDNSKEWNEKGKEMAALLKLWKTIGPAPKEYNDEVWERFKSSLDAFFEHKNTHFESIKDEQKENLNKKINICIQAEAMQDSKDWSRTTKDIIALQKEWKRIGPVSRAQSDKVWKRFRAACDKFFDAKAKFYENIGEHEEENLKAKQALIQEIKEFSFSEDKAAALDELKKFQRKWSDIGTVPRKNHGELQSLYRATIDEVMSKLDISNYEKKSIRFKSKYDKLLSTADANTIRKEIGQLSNRCSKLQGDINVWENNIGFLSGSKNAEAFKADFEKKIEKARKELDVLQEELAFLKKQKK
jgi:hypothetical protein